MLSQRGLQNSNETSGIKERESSLDGGSEECVVDFDGFINTERADMR